MPCKWVWWCCGAFTSLFYPDFNEGLQYKVYKGYNGYNGGAVALSLLCFTLIKVYNGYNGYNGGWPSARLFGWSAAD